MDIYTGVLGTQNLYHCSEMAEGKFVQALRARFRRAHFRPRILLPPLFARVSLKMSESSNPKVSVIVPNYNHARFLKQRLDTVLAQTFQDFELILLDDCSRDESQSILSEYSRNPRVTQIEFNKTNSGSTFKQWNKGVRLARGKYVWIAESDDYADECLLETLVSRLDADPDLAFCYCRSCKISEDNQILGFLDAYLSDLNPQKWTEDFLVDGREECQKYLVHRNTITGTSSVLFRNAVYEAVGGADESLILCGDWKTWASMAITGGRIAYVARPLNFQRFHMDSVTVTSQQFGLKADEYLQVVRWILQRVTTTHATRTKLCDDLFDIWCPNVLTSHNPASRRWRILRNATAIDRHALRKLVRPAIVACRATLIRRLRSNE
jgi:glycosyltransferase involved in cell wall biosynthesis